jgi:hypothetical protein
MATTETILLGDGTTTQFGFTFPYIKTEDVKVELQEFDTVESTVISRVQISSFSIPSNNPTVVDFSAIGAATNYQAITGAPLTNHAVNTSNIIRVRIYRFTSADANPATFLQGSTIRAQDLNDNFEQILYIMQERQNTLQTIQLGGIGENIIGTVSIQDDAITADKLSDSTVTDSDRAVTTNHIRDNAVTTAKLASDLTVDLASGTVGSPSLTFDANTGLYSPGEDQVALSTGGTGRLFINASGNVGIGTGLPTHLFQAVSSGTSSEAVAAFGNANIANGLQIQTNGNLDWGFNALNSRNLTFSTNQWERLRITSTGTLMHLSAGNSTTPAVQFNGSAPINSLVIDSTGKVGMGTASPSVKLEVARLGAAWTGAAPAAGTALFIHNGNNGDTSPANLQFGAGNNANSAVYFGDSDDDNIGAIFYNHSDDSLAFRVNNNERARIDSSGRLLVGTSSSSGSNALVAQGNSLGANQQGVIVIASDKSTFSSGDNYGTLSFSDNTHARTASIEALVDGTFTAGSSRPSRLVFSTIANGSSSPTERMRIASTGALGLSGANYGNSGQVLTSNGSGSAPSWQTAPTAKAWVHFDGTAATITPADSYNVSSITDRGTGRYTVNLTNTLGSTNPACFASGTADSTKIGNASPDSTDPDDKIAVGFKGTNDQFYDDDNVSVVVFA